MSKQENKQTVLDSIYAFDASTAVMESIMEEGEVQYGVQDDDDDLIVTPDGDEVVDPARLMTVKVNDPVTTGPQFINEVEPMTEDDKAFYVDEFAKRMANLHKTVVTDDDIEGVTAAIQMDAGTIQDVTGFIMSEIKGAESRLSCQNANEVLDDGVVSDMTGDGVVSSAEVADVPEAPAQAEAEDDGFKELKPTTHLKPEGEDEPEQEDIDIGLGEEEANPFEDENLWNDEEEAEDDESNPFNDLNMGDEEASEEKEEESSEEPVEEEKIEEKEEEVAEEPAEEKEESEEEEKKEEEPEEEEKKEEEPEEKKEEEPSEPEAVTESVRREAAKKALIECADAMYNKCKLKARCEAIVAEANAKIAKKAQLESAKVAKENSIKAQCESIISAYKSATSKKSVKSKFESIVNSVAKKSSLKAQCESIISEYKAKKALNAKLNAIVEGIEGVDEAPAGEVAYGEGEKCDCPECKGEGFITGFDGNPVKCEKCDGTGKVSCDEVVYAECGGFCGKKKSKFPVESVESKLDAIVESLSQKKKQSVKARVESIIAKYKSKK